MVDNKKQADTNIVVPEEKIKFLTETQIRQQLENRFITGEQLSKPGE